MSDHVEVVSCAFCFQADELESMHTIRLDADRTVSRPEIVLCTACVGAIVSYAMEQAKIEASGSVSHDDKPTGSELPDQPEHNPGDEPGRGEPPMDLAIETPASSDAEPKIPGETGDASKRRRAARRGLSDARSSE